MFFRNFSFTGNIEAVSIPESGIYRIIAWGSSGGGTNKPLGAFSESFTFLESGSTLHVLVGESGGTGYTGSSDIRCGGGGGGTFISVGLSLSLSSPLCVAGGGGSQTATDIISLHSYGQSTRTGGDLFGRVQEEGSSGFGDQGSGGGGFYSNGIKGNSVTYSGNPGISYLNGGTRVAGTSYSTAYGGFGGGASNHGSCGKPQGGGGYSGGSSYGDSSNNGGGGGSFFLNYSDYIGRSIAGYDYMPNPSGPDLIQGNHGNGFAQIHIILYQSSNTHGNNCTAPIHYFLVIASLQIFTMFQSILLN